MSVPIGSTPQPLKECYDDPNIIYKEPVCLMSLSKNVKGRLVLTESETQTCNLPSCTTLKTIHALTLELEDHAPCEEADSFIFAGKIIIDQLITAFKEDGLQRGFHAGEFQWQGPGVWGAGRMSGVTNAGTHRDPLMNCQDCYSPGYMEGRICAYFGMSDWPPFKDSDLIGTYCFKFDPALGGTEGVLTGVIEAVIIRRCK